MFKDELPQKIKVNENDIKFFCARISTKDWKTRIQMVLKHSQNHLDLQLNAAIFNF